MPAFLQMILNRKGNNIIMKIKKVLSIALALVLSLSFTVNAFSLNEGGVYSYPDSTLTPQVKTAGTLSNDIGLSVLSTSAAGTIEYIDLMISGGKEYAFLPAYTDLNAVIFHYNAGINLVINTGKEEIPVVSDTPVSISKYLSKADAEGAKALNLRAYINELPFDYTLYIMKSETIASVFINTNDPANKGLYYVATNKTFKVPGAMNMVNADGSLVYTGGLDHLKTRGNSTWMCVKKPFQIKLSAKTDLIQTGDKDNEEKTWILLANSYDPTLIHNTVAFDMAKKLGLVAPDSRPVDLYVDHRYMGSYLLCEKVQKGEGRVNIDDNGYILEMDVAYYTTEENYIIDASGTPFVINTPEDVSESSKKAIEGFMNEVILSVMNGGISPTTGASVWDLVDIDSMAAMYVLEETVKDPDAYTSSAYFYLPAGGKLMAGPVWDFDSSFGIRAEIGQDAPENSCAYPVWIGKFLELPEFKKAVKEKEKILNSYTSTVVNSKINTYSKEIAASEKMNRAVWKDYNTDMYPVLPTYKENITFFKNFLRKRNSWVYSYLNRL